MNRRSASYGRNGREQTKGDFMNEQLWSINALIVTLLQRIGIDPIHLLVWH